jgi:hypothetical protein
VYEQVQFFHVLVYLLCLIFLLWFSNNTLAVCGFASHPFSDQFLERCFSSCFLGFEGGAAACQGAAPVERQ